MGEDTKVLQVQLVMQVHKETRDLMDLKVPLGLQVQKVLLELLEFQGWMADQDLLGFLENLVQQDLLVYLVIMYVNNPRFYTPCYKVCILKQ